MITLRLMPEDLTPDPDPAELNLDLERLLGLPRRTPAEGIAAMTERIEFLTAEIAGTLELMAACNEADLPRVESVLAMHRRVLAQARQLLAQYQLQQRSKN